MIWSLKINHIQDRFNLLWTYNITIGGIQLIIEKHEWHSAFLNEKKCQINTTECHVISNNRSFSISIITGGQQFFFLFFIRMLPFKWQWIKTNAGVFWFLGYVFCLIWVICIYLPLLLFMSSTWTIILSNRGCLKFMFVVFVFAKCIVLYHAVIFPHFHISWYMILS